MTSANTEVRPHIGSQFIFGYVQTLLNTTFYAKASVMEPIYPIYRRSIPDGLAMAVDVSGAWFIYVEAVRRPDAAAPVALEVARPPPIFVWTILGEVFCCAHNELYLVIWISYPLGIDIVFEVVIRRVEMNEGLIVEVFEADALNFRGKLPQTRLLLSVSTVREFEGVAGCPAERLVC